MGAIFNGLAIVISILFMAVAVVVLIVVLADIIGDELERRWRKTTEKIEKRAKETKRGKFDLSKTPEWIEEPENIIYDRERWASSTLVGKTLFMVTDGKIVETMVSKGWYSIDGGEALVGIQLFCADGNTVDYSDLSHTENLFNSIEDCKANKSIKFYIPEGLRWIIEKYRIGQWYDTIGEGFDSFVRWEWDGVRAVPYRPFSIYLDGFDEEGLRVRFVNENTKEKDLHYVGNPIDQKAQVWDGTYPSKEECEKANEIEIVRFNDECAQKAIL